MVKRFNNSDTLERFKKHVESLKIETVSMTEAINYAIRTAKNGQDCALIVGLNEDNYAVTNTLRVYLEQQGIATKSGGSGGFLLENNAVIRVFTENLQTPINIFMPEAKIIKVKEGDPLLKKAKDLFDL